MATLLLFMSSRAEVFVAQVDRQLSFYHQEEEEEEDEIPALKMHGGDITELLLCIKEYIQAFDCRQ